MLLPTYPKNGHKPVILIVDDTPSNIQILAQGLVKYYTIQIATSGKSALELLQKNDKPDLILLDIMMPEMDGHEVCRRIKQDPALWQIPVIFVTARSEVADQQLGFALGAVDYITKPIEMPLVLARVKVHIRLKQQSEWLERLAMLDGLTDIPNRRAFEETLKQECQRASRSNTPLSLLMIDVDFFKAYNDHYGHGAGDECLRQLAHCLSASLQRTGDFAARYGGEEFVVILPNCDTNGAHNIANHLNQQIQQLNIAHAYSSVAPVVTVSVGLASSLILPDESAERLLQQADLALYQAKQQGRNQVAIYEGTSLGG